MNDIIKEIQEDLKQERMNRFILTYGKYIIGGIILIALILAFYTMKQKKEEEALSYETSLLYQVITSKSREEASNRIEKMQEGKLADLANLLQADLTLAKDKNKTIEELSNLLERAEKANNNLLSDIIAMKLSFLDSKVLQNKKFDIFSNIINFNEVLGDLEGKKSELFAIIVNPYAGYELKKFAMEINSLQ